MLLPRRLGLCLCLSLLNAIPLCRAKFTERFDEQLTVIPLRDGKVASTFAFTTVLEGASPRDPQTLSNDDESQHYTLFPLALGQILREYGVSELHLTLNAGKWDYDRWGYPLERGVGTGAELWAWIGDGAVTSVDERWKGLRNALAGLFCASLGSLDELRTTSPSETFQPEGSLPDWELGHQLRHASLASENVCTENLTPFLKLLPCKSLSGVASLLNPHRLFDANWHGMGVHVLWREHDGVEVRLTFQTVSDPLRASSKKQDWSFESSFGWYIDKSCPVARSSQIIASLPRDAAYNVSPEPTMITENEAHYDVKSAQKPLNVAMSWLSDFQTHLGSQNQEPLTSVSIQRTLKESSQAHGQLSVLLTNHEASVMEVLYLETMPWIVQFYLHTLRPSIDGIVQDGVISNISYIPAVPHSRPTTFQAVVTIPPKSTVRLTMDVTKAFLRYTEHPPDAQRGWDLPPAIIMPLNNLNSSSTGRMYTPTLLVDLATPDFSMPYNVIIFTCSLMAFIFGSIFNLLTRKFVVVSLDSKNQD